MARHNNRKTVRGHERTYRTTSRNDDYRKRFVYRKGKDVIHDRDCEQARKIPASELIAVPEYVEYMRQCPQCEMKAYTRIGAKDIYFYEQYETFYKKVKMMPTLARHMFVEKHMRCKIYRDILTIWDRQDTWQIEALDEYGHVCLYHNNYHVEAGKRIFEKEFHVQSDNTARTDIAHAIQTIESYSWLEHQKAQEEVISRDSRKIGKKKESIWLRLSHFFAKVDKDKKQASQGQTPVYYEKNIKGNRSIQFKDLKYIEKDGVPYNGMRCIYLWKNQAGLVKCQVGYYDYYNHRFVVNYNGNDFYTNENKVIAWKLLEDFEIK